MSQETNASENERWLAAVSLAQDLSAWRRAAGFDPDEDDGGLIISSGESNAAIARFKQQLTDLGVDYHWCEACQEYHLRLLPPAAETEQNA